MREVCCTYENYGFVNLFVRFSMSPAARPKRSKQRGYQRNQQENFEECVLQVDCSCEINFVGLYRQLEREKIWTAEYFCNFVDCVLVRSCEESAYRLYSYYYYLKQCDILIPSISMYLLFNQKIGKLKKVFIIKKIIPTLNNYIKQFISLSLF